MRARRRQERQRPQPSFRLKVTEIGTCRPLAGVLENAPRGNAYWGERCDGVTTCKSRQICEQNTAFVTRLLLHTVFGALLWQAPVTLISAPCCSRCQTAALQPRPPERNAFRTWGRDKRRNSSIYVNNWNEWGLLFCALPEHTVKMSLLP